MRLEEALNSVLAMVTVVESESITLQDCHRRILAQTVVASTDFPPFDRSPLDGYAVVHEDVLHAAPGHPVILTEIDNVPAGSLARKSMQRGEAIRIMTGAPIPVGASGVIPLEETEVQGTQVKVLVGKNAARNICAQGEEITYGEVVLQPGTPLNGGSIGLLAMLGVDQPKVYRKPRVGILATGSEIIDIKDELTPGKIRNSNSYMLAAQICEAGGVPVLLGQVEDSIEAIVLRLRHAPLCDIYITTGGASVGDYDLLGPVFQKLNARLMFHRVAMKPGMPVLVGKWNDAMLVGLSGNPAAAAVAFEMLIRPAIRKMAGYRVWQRTRATGVLRESFGKTSDMRRFVWANCIPGPQGYKVTPLFLQGNGMLKSMAFANALLDIAAGSPALQAGDIVDVILMHQE